MEHSIPRLAGFPSSGALMQHLVNPRTIPTYEMIVWAGERPEEAVPLLSGVIELRLREKYPSHDHVCVLIQLAWLLLLTRRIDALGPTLQVLTKVESRDQEGYDKLIHCVPEMLEDAQDALIVKYHATTDDDERHTIADTLIGFGKDERVLEVVVEQLQVDHKRGAKLAALYQDSRLIPHLVSAFEKHVHVNDEGEPMGCAMLAVLRDVIGTLGGALSPEQEQTFQRAYSNTRRVVDAAHAEGKKRRVHRRRKPRRKRKR